MTTYILLSFLLYVWVLGAQLVDLGVFARLHLLLKISPYNILEKILF